MMAADADSVGRIGFEAWAANPVLNGYGTDMVDRIRAGFQRFADLHFDLITVAEHEGEILGWTAREGDRDYISDLWVAPGCQGSGIGSGLVHVLLDRMRVEGLFQARISTHARNEGAIRLYQRLGFAIVWQGIEHSPAMGMMVEKVRMLRAL